MKVLKIALAVLVVLLVVVLLAVNFFLGDIVKTGVETAGPSILGVSVKLDDADVRLIRGFAKLDGLVIGNPEGFKTPFLFSMGELVVKVDVSSITTDTIIIEEIHILAPEISYEKSLKTSNIAALLQNLEGDEEAQPAAESEEPSAEPAEEDTGGKRVIIRDLVIDDAKVKLSATLTGGHAMSIPLPQVHMTGIGEDSGGAGIAEVITEVLKALTGAVTDAVAGTVKLVGDGAELVGATAVEGAKLAGEGVKAVGGAAVDGAEAVGGAAVDGTKAVGGAVVDGTKAVGGGVKKVGSGIAGGASKLLGGAKDLVTSEDEED